MKMEATIVRDTYGVPHIFADSDETACFALGYVQAEDRLSALLRNFRIARGEMAALYGDEFVESDFQKFVMGIPQFAQRAITQIAPAIRRLIEAFTAGVNHYMHEHRNALPEGARDVTVADVLAFTRWMVLQWSWGQALHELEAWRAEQGHNTSDCEQGVESNSNSWALAPQRTAIGTPIRLIDPHVPWDGEYRWYEVHIHTSSVNVAGFALVGIPGITLGFNEYLSWSATAGGPDTADVYLLQLSRDGKHYRYDGGWRDIAEEPVIIKVRRGDKLHSEKRVIRYSHHGPIIHHEDDLAVAVRSAYAELWGLGQQLFEMNRATSLDEFKRALSRFEFPPQNVIVATVAGDIFYFLNGRTPRRNEKYNYSKPVPGWTSDTEWRGYLTVDELPQLLNPPAGFLQNCNNSPQWVTTEGTIDEGAYPSYAVYSHIGDVYRARSMRARELLAGAWGIDAEDAMRYAFDSLVPSAHAWISALREAVKRIGVDGNALLERALKMLTTWDGRFRADSVGATVYRFWRMFYAEHHPEVNSDNEMRCVPRNTEQQQDAIDALRKAVDYLSNKFGKLEVPLRNVQRMQRGKHDIGVGGLQSSKLGDCLRAVWTRDPDERGRCIATGGQSCTCIVIHTHPPKAFSITPYGQSDNEHSPHYFDQAELYATERMKPMWFGRAALKGHIESERSL